MIPETGLQLRSKMLSSGRLELSLERVPLPAPGPSEVVVRIEATPINPSDLGLLFGGADMTTAKALGTPEQPVVVADVPPEALRAARARLDVSLPVGNEGAGVVVGAGADPAAQALVGRTVGLVGGAMYAEYRVLPAQQCLPLAEGTPPRAGASCFVNPLTALGMVETMRMEGHTALVHTAAASNLGQMLVKLCARDGVGLVNVVRRPEQAALLRELGAEHVVSSASEDFVQALLAAVRTTGATLGFDATGGGGLASQILTAMELALTADAKPTDRYGSSTHKQVYIYGRLDPSPTELTRNYGMAWGVGGWLLTPFLQKAGPEVVARLRQRVADELETTFASHYSRSVSLAGALALDAIAAYGRQATGQKFLIEPHTRG